MIRILLADDHRLVRAGMHSLLQSRGGFEIVAETGDGREAVSLSRRLQPDIVVLDIGMPGLNGLEAAARIAKETPQTRVVMLSMHTSEHYVLEALRVGAMGYVLKDAAVEELEQALRAVLRGDLWLSPGVSRYLLNDYRRLSHGAASDQTRSALELLTPRQREILQLIAEGHSSREIAKRLSLSQKTVENHRTQIMERLDIRDIPGLTRFAIRTGLVSGTD
jgi:RNA polymerase sigma factor (sigma-70 family)